MKGCVQNVKLQFYHNLFYLCSLHLVPLCLGFLMLKVYSEKYSENSRYEKCFMVYGGYLPAPSIKDHNHIRRLRKLTIVPNILV